MAPMIGLVTSALGRPTDTLRCCSRYPANASRSWRKRCPPLPRELAAKIENLAIIINDTALGENLFGLYEGIPLQARSEQLQRRHA